MRPSARGPCPARRRGRFLDPEQNLTHRPSVKRHYAAAVEPARTLRDPSPVSIAPESAAFPSWLASLVIHMSMVLLLGLAYQAVPRDAGVELTLNYDADPGLTDFDAGGGGDPLNDSLDMPAAEDVLFSAAVASEAAFDDVPLAGVVEIETDSLLASAATPNDFAIETTSLFAASHDVTAGRGDGGSGDGSGGGHGDGIGAGIGNGRGPGHAYTSMFGLEGEGGDFVYVFDRSDSMNTYYTLEDDGALEVTVTPLEAAKNELSRSLGDLNRSCRFQVVFYNDSAVAYGNTLALAAATSNNVAGVRQFVREMPAEDGTNHLAGLERAIMCRPQVIFLLTDAEQKDDPSIETVRQLAHLCKRANIKINIIHFCIEVRTTGTLRDLARLTGGQHKFITLRELALAKMRSIRGEDEEERKPMKALPALD